MKRTKQVNNNKPKKPKGMADMAEVQVADHIKITDKLSGKEIVSKRG